MLTFNSLISSLNAQSCSSPDSNLVSDKKQVPSKREPVFYAKLKLFRETFPLIRTVETSTILKWEEL
jgi:hypothetical protein